MRKDKEMMENRRRLLTNTDKTRSKVQSVHRQMVQEQFGGNNRIMKHFFCLLMFPCQICWSRGPADTLSGLLHHKLSLLSELAVDFSLFSLKFCGFKFLHCSCCYWQLLHLTEEQLPCPSCET